MAYFRDRDDAAEQLVAMLPEEIGPDWLVLALPRGGVPIGAAIARHLGAPLDLLIVRKVGAPGDPELALGAVTGPGPEALTINDEVRALPVPAQAHGRDAPERHDVEVEVASLGLLLARDEGGLLLLVRVVDLLHGRVRLHRLVLLELGHVAHRLHGPSASLGVAIGGGHRRDQQGLLALP